MRAAAAPARPSRRWRRRPGCGGSGAARAAPPRPPPRRRTRRARPGRAAAPGAVRRACAPASPAASPTRRPTSSAAWCAAARSPACSGATTTRAPGPSSTGCAPTAAWSRARPSPGAQAVDWEDIAAGPAPDGRAAALRRRHRRQRARGAPTIDVYRVAEPRVGAAATAPAARLRLRYPDGAHDAEALLVDPLRGDLVIVTKVLGAARAYRASAAAARRVADDAARGPGDRARRSSPPATSAPTGGRRPARLRPRRRLGPPRPRAPDDDAAPRAVPVADVAGRRGPGRGDRARPPRHELRHRRRGIAGGAAPLRAGR